jgi:WD40 repeat protein
LRHPDTILSLEYIAHERHICAGCQNSTIQVWSATTFQCIRVLMGHSRAVLALHAAKGGEGWLTSCCLHVDVCMCVIECTPLCCEYAGQHLLSSSNDNTVRVWSIRQKYQCVAVIPAPIGNVLVLTGALHRRASVLPVLVGRVT